MKRRFLSTTTYLMSTSGDAMSALTSCKTCSKEVARSAKICPHCGARLKPRFIAQLFVIFAVLFVIALVFGRSNNEERAQQLQSLEQTAKSEPKDALALEQQTITIEPHGELAQMFSLMSPNTDLQRETKFQELRGKTVAWKLTVYEVRRLGEEYEVQTAAENEVPTFIRISPRSEEDHQQLLQLKTGDAIHVRGQVSKVRLRHLVLQPAILVRPAQAPVTSASTPTATPLAREPLPNPSTSAQSTQRSAEAIADDLQRAAQKTASVYQSGGMVGLIEQVSECYASDKNRYYCIYLDVAARGVDQAVAAANPKFPRSDFFANEPFGQRIGPILIDAGLTLEEANEYLATITPTINKLVKEQFGKAAKGARAPRPRTILAALTSAGH